MIQIGAAVLFLASLIASTATQVCQVYPPDGSLWNDDGDAAAFAGRDTEFNFDVYLQREDGSFLCIDASRIESTNLGKLGVESAAYERIETTPVRWLDRSDSLLQVVVKTHVWKQGQKFSVEEALLIRKDGTVLWR